MVNLRASTLQDTYLSLTTTRHSLFTGLRIAPDKKAESSRKSCLKKVGPKDNRNRTGGKADDGCLWIEEKWNITLLCQVPQARRRAKTRPVSSTSNEWTHRLPRQKEIFSTSDACSGYRHMKLDGTDRITTAITSHHKLYWIRCMQFGLQNAPGRFRPTKNRILSTVSWRFAFCA